MAANCCHPDCTVGLQAGHIACLDHWRSVPKEIKREVQIRLRCWNDMLAAREFLNRWFAKHRKD